MTEGEVGKLKELLLLALSAKAYREAERAASLGDVQAASPGEGATPAVNGPLRDVLQLQLIPSDELKAPELKRGEVNLGDGLKSALLDLGFNDLDEESLPLVLERLLALVGEGAGRTEEVGVRHERE